MAHKADASFFDHKRVWSKRKDQILSYYLDPYLAKIRQRRNPVLLVDGFAGPGKFGDGEIGSPLLMCAKAQSALAITGPPIGVLCIESDPALFSKLEQNLSGFPFANAISGEFLAQVDRIVSAAKTSSVFLYMDPFVASDVEWEALEQIARLIGTANASVELLLNFNTPSFVRWGLAALSRPVPDIDAEVEDPEQADAMTPAPPALERLSRVVGGPWWREILDANRSFPEMLRDVADGFGAKLRTQFSEVCWLAIKKLETHRVPKYDMFFGSRHPDALELMNDAMVKARGVSDFQIDLFAVDDLDQAILRLTADWIKRGALILAVIRESFCRFLRKDIRGRVEALLKDGSLESETGKPRINDDVRVRCKGA